MRVRECKGPHMLEVSDHPPGAGVTGNCKTPNMVLGQNSGPLEPNHLFNSPSHPTFTLVCVLSMYCLVLLHLSASLFLLRLWLKEVWFCF